MLQHCPIFLQSVILLLSLQVGDEDALAKLTETDPAGGNEAKAGVGLSQESPSSSFNVSEVGFPTRFLCTL